MEVWARKNNFKKGYGHLHKHAIIHKHFGHISHKHFGHISNIQVSQMFLVGINSLNIIQGTSGSPSQTHRQAHTFSSRLPYSPPHTYILSHPPPPPPSTHTHSDSLTPPLFYPHTHTQIPRALRSMVLNPSMPHPSDFQVF